MVVLEIFGMNGVGKTTTMKEIKKLTDLKTPVADIEKLPYIKRNLMKIPAVTRVVFSDFYFSIKLYKTFFEKHRTFIETSKIWFNTIHRGYYYLYSKDSEILMSGGLIHQLWKTYGFYPIKEKDKIDIKIILQRFNCNGGYYLMESKEVIKERITNRGTNCMIEQKITELDYIYKNFQRYVEVIESICDIQFVPGTSLEERVKFIISNSVSTSKTNLDDKYGSV